LVNVGAGVGVWVDVGRIGVEVEVEVEVDVGKGGKVGETVGAVVLVEVVFKRGVCVGVWVGNV
jgi:hypothetical protein